MAAEELVSKKKGMSLDWDYFGFKLLVYNYSIIIIIVKIFELVSD